MTATVISWQASMQAIADKIRAQRNAKVAEWRKNHPTPAPAQRTVADVLADIARVSQGFDPGYEQSDDYSVYVINRSKAEQLRALRRELAALEG